MKILVITDLYPINEDEKYTPRTIYNFVQSWKNQGHEVRIIRPNFLFNSFLRKKKYYKSGIYGEVENINYFLPFSGNISKKIKTSLDADIIVAHMPSGIIFANRLGLKFSAAVHSSDVEVLTNPIYRIYFKPEMEKAYKNAQKIACRSFALKDKFLNIYPEYENKTFVAPSGILQIPALRRWRDSVNIKILTCGQFIKRKNIDKVIKACEKFENVELTVIGSGKEEKYLRKLSSKVLFLGQISQKEVLERMKESDIFILPSVNETFGMVYLEAMASGCITVCTENDGISGIIIDGENGFFTKPDDVEETIKRILEHPDKNMILENAYKTISNFSQDKVSKDYIDNLM